jgi:hypothetical protein
VGARPGPATWSRLELLRWWRDPNYRDPIDRAALDWTDDVERVAIAAHLMASNTPETVASMLGSESSRAAMSDLWAALGPAGPPALPGPDGDRARRRRPRDAVSSLTVVETVVAVTRVSRRSSETCRDLRPVAMSEGYAAPVTGQPAREQRLRLGPSERPRAAGHPLGRRL